MALILEVPATIYNGQVTVTTAGTKVMLAQNTQIKSVTIKALAANTGLIYIGNSSVSSSNGFQLSSRDTISLDIANLNMIYIDAQNSGEGVAYIAVN